MICEQLKTRYGMDGELWQKSQERRFPFNASLLTVLGLCALGVGITCMLPARSILSDYNLVACCLTTTLLSVLAFYMTDALIVEFKSKLEAKGLFGRDLNKIGDHRDESKEKM